jgi:DNA invertase Pin-like site-specific DNA recombinase
VIVHLHRSSKFFSFQHAPRASCWNLSTGIGKAGAAFRSLGDPLWDTFNAQGRLLSTLLASIAEFEREPIRERTGEGRKRAIANGVKFGRKRKLSDYQRAEAIKRRAGGETLATIAKSYGVDISMISRL